MFHLFLSATSHYCTIFIYFRASLATISFSLCLILLLLCIFLPNVVPVNTPTLYNVGLILSFLSSNYSSLFSVLLTQYFLILNFSLILVLLCIFLSLIFRLILVLLRIFLSFIFRLILVLNSISLFKSVLANTPIPYNFGLTPSILSVNYSSLFSVLHTQYIISFSLILVLICIFLSKIVLANTPIPYNFRLIPSILSENYSSLFPVLHTQYIISFSLILILPSLHFFLPKVVLVNTPIFYNFSLIPSFLSANYFSLFSVLHTLYIIFFRNTKYS